MKPSGCVFIIQRVLWQIGVWVKENCWRWRFFKADTLVCCGGLHDWWSTQSQLAAFLSSFVACQQIGPLLYYRSVKVLSIKERDGAWCCLCGHACRGLSVRFHFLGCLFVCAVEFLSL